MRLLIILLCLLTLSCGAPSPVQNISQVTDDHFSYSDLKVEKGLTEFYGTNPPVYQIRYVVTGKIHNRSGINLEASFTIFVQTSEGTKTSQISRLFLAIDEKSDFSYSSSFTVYAPAHFDYDLLYSPKIEFKEDVTLEYIPVAEY